jgi:type I restriction enzyme S subunit
VSNPKGWKKEPVEKHIDLLSGYPFRSDKYVDNGVNICGGLIIMPQRIQWENCMHWKSIDGFEEYTLKENDIVMALDRPWISEGFKIAKVDATHLPALLIQRTARIRSIDINQDYLYCYFINGGFDKHSNVTGSLVPHISAKDIKSFEVMLPPLELQNQFADFVKGVDKSKVIGLNTLRCLQYSLMPKFIKA